MEITKVKAYEQQIATTTQFEVTVNGVDYVGVLDWSREDGYEWQFDFATDDFYEWLEDEKNNDALINAIEAVAENGTGAK